MIRRIQLVACLLAAAASTFAADDRKPNIVVIVADDLGYADLGVHGGTEIPTPEIDKLAHSGVRLTSGYVSCPVCSPTRAGLLTGRYQQRFGHETNAGSANDDFGLPLTETTLADRLKKAGYRTGMVGKWHLGHADKFQPLNRGFQEFFGFLEGSHAYLPGTGDVDGPNAIRRGRDIVREKEYLTDAFAREAVAFIERGKSEPFFLYLPFNAVHNPLEARDDDLRSLDKISGKKRRNYAGMLAAMDRAVGKVTEKLRQEKLDENTLIFFISDNGGPTATASSNGELRGRKTQTWEGGVRVPFFVSWPGKLPADKVYSQPAIQLDIAPTALAAAGLAAPREAKFDGVNLLPYLKGEQDAPPHEKLYWRFDSQFAIRAGDWKLVRGAGADDAILVNLAEDIGERKDLSAEQSAKRKELQAAWDAWNKELAEPKFKTKQAPEGGKKKKKAAA